MTKKKNISKKHKFKHVESAELTQQIQDAPAGVMSPVKAVRPPSSASASSVRDFSYVGGDVRRIGALAVSLVVVELVMYYALAHTALGTAVYSLVKV